MLLHDLRQVVDGGVQTQRVLHLLEDRVALIECRAGIHASGLLKDTKTYEHVPPHSVGNQRQILVSNQSGRSNVMATLDAMGLAAGANEELLAALLDEVKRRESDGYLY